MIILPFLSPAATLENAGGNGASLARLSRLGLPVPPGFIVTTHAYRAFVAANNLTVVIMASITGVAADDAAQLERASAQIRTVFSAGRLPEEIPQAISAVYLALKPPAAGNGGNSVADGQSSAVSVAVRSSATTEDLP